MATKLELSRAGTLKQWRKPVGHAARLPFPPLLPLSESRHPDYAKAKTVEL
jgi:hypothetical protein